MNRRRIPRRVAQVLNALDALPQKTRELKEAERAEARLRKKQARLESQALDRAESDRLRAKDIAREAARRTGYVPAGHVPTGPSISIQTVPPDVHPAHKPPAPEALYETKVDRDGNVTRRPVVGRDGQPLTASKPEAPKPAEPVALASPEPPRDPNRQPPETAGLTPPDGEWFNGCGRPRSALERWRVGRAAGQGNTVSAGFHVQSDMPQPGPPFFREDYGFDDPGGVVSQAMNSSRRKWTTAGDWGL